jgi:hypothetical protein
VAGLCLTGFAASEVASEAFEPPGKGPAKLHPRRPAGPAPRCDGYRWPVKTLADTGAGRVDTTVRDTTVGALAALGTHHGGASRLGPFETHVWRLSSVTLVGLERQPDGDIHLVVEDGAGHTMITEVPSPSCLSRARPDLMPEMKAARSNLIRVYGDPGRGFRPILGRATVTGVGFFDYPHHQQGAAPNAVELHPLLSFSLTG